MEEFIAVLASSSMLSNICIAMCYYIIGHILGLIF